MFNLTNQKDLFKTLLRVITIVYLHVCHSVLINFWPLYVANIPVNKVWVKDKITIGWGWEITSKILKEGNLVKCEN